MSPSPRQADSHISAAPAPAALFNEAAGRSASLSPRRHASGTEVAPDNDSDLLRDLTHATAPRKRERMVFVSLAPIKALYTKS